MAMRTHYRTCNLCEAMCGLEIKVDGDEVLSIRGDRNDPFSRGHICPKAVALQDVYHDPNRLKYPVRRTESGWERIGWDEAFDEVVSGITAIQEKYGVNAVGAYLGNPNVHNFGSMLFGSPFLRALRSRNRFSATSVDQLPHHFAGYFMFGHQLLLPVPDIDRTDFFLILGANPLASNGSLMTAPGMVRRLRELQERGGKFVVVDPRRSETAEKADEHFFIRPGSDVLLLLGLLHTVYDENLANPGRLAEFTDGLEEIQEIVADFSPEKVAPMTGIEATKIRQLAREFTAANSAVCYGRMGASTQPFGAVTQWLINVFNVVTGNLDRAGGAMFSLPAVDLVDITGNVFRSTGHYGVWYSRVRGLPEFNGELPVAALAEEILTEGAGQIKGMVTVAGNPVLSTPNGTQLEKGLAGLDFMVSIDIYINETTRHANIILPPTTGLETDNYDLIFHVFAVRNTAKYSPALFEPAEGTKHDWQILRELRLRLEEKANKGNKGKKKSGRNKYDLTRRLSPDKVVDVALRFGPYGAWGKEGQEDKPSEGLKLSTLKKEVHGVDLGPLQPCLPERLFTPSKRIQLAPELLVADLERVKSTYFAPAHPNGSAQYDLSLIGRRQLRSNNSWMHNSKRLVRGKERCTLLIHPTDADARHIRDGQQVTVQSRVGQLNITTQISDEIMPGVVSIPHGWGHHRPGIQLDTAQQHPGVSINDLTDDYALDELSGNAAFSGVPVKVWAT
ncbi:MAG: molybdopterin oxidoreductase family protein [Ardenticatenaceae bacterium]